MFATKPRKRRTICRTCGVVFVFCFGVVGAFAWVQSWEPVVRRAHLQLSIDPVSGSCKVVDLRTKAEWSSLQANNKKQNSFWATAYHSAIVVRYLNGGELKTLYTGQTDCRKAFERMPQGIRCRFSFSQPRLSLEIEYTLTPDDSLRVNIPFRGIFDPAGGLLDVRVLPYFGGLSLHSQGYVVLPDGCGGIIRSGRMKSLAYYGARVYGERFFWTVEMDRNNRYGSNQRYINFYDYTDPNTVRLNLPLFGIVRGGSAVLGIIASGAGQAEIGPEVTPGDFTLSVSPRLIFRELTYDMFTRAHAAPVFSREDRTVIYYFLDDKEASYAGMANRYRRLLLAGINKNGRCRKVQSACRLRIMCGVERKYKDTRDLICLTDLRQAEEMLKDLHRSGVRNLQVVLVGWSKRGYLGDEPVHFPPDRRFGGLIGLKRLLRTGERLGYAVGLEFNNSFIWKDSSGYRRQPTVKDIQNIAVELGPKTGEYLYCPRIAWKRFFKEDYKKFRDLKVKGCLLIDGLEQGLFTCLDENHPFGPPDTIRTLQMSVRKMREHNPVGMIGAMGYLFSEASSFWDLPSTCSTLCDQPVPLTPMILHGWAGYSFEPINLRRDGRRDFLRMVEYGAIPEAFLTFRTVEDLSDARYNPLFSGRYDDWRRPFLKEYRQYVKDLQDLQNRFIVDHRRLERDVYLTRYDDGREVVTNYSSESYSYKNYVVPACSYHVYQ